MARQRMWTLQAHLWALVLLFSLTACSDTKNDGGDPADVLDVDASDAGADLDAGAADAGGDAFADASDADAFADASDADAFADASDADAFADASDGDAFPDASDADTASDASDADTASDASDGDAFPDAGDADTLVDASDGDTFADAHDGDTFADAETGFDAGHDADGDAIIIEPGEDPMITHLGDAGFLLRGDILTPEGVIVDGDVLIVGELITCVGDCFDAPGFADATEIETGGIISPGLIDAHNHLAYNFLPEWVPPGGRLYENRYQWADEPSYEDWVLPYTANRSSNSHFCPGAQWGELRSLLHGTTTIQGQSFERTCTDGLVRNADHDHGLGDDHMRTTIGSVRDINDDAADGYVESFADDITRFCVHMQEGYAENNVLLEFESFAGRDTRSNRHMGLSLLDTTSVLIHSISLTETQLDEAETAGSYIVWSPSSNMALYDTTLNLESVLSRDIVVGIGPDWTLSGEDDLLGELAFAADWAAENGVTLSSQRLWQMATYDGAEVVGLGDRTGRIAIGYAADVTIFRSTLEDPFESVVRATATDVTGVFIGGELTYGVDSLRDAVDGCEDLDVCDDLRFVCRPDDDTFTTVGDIAQELTDILEGTGFPEDEQYGRGDDLLPLVNCGG